MTGPERGASFSLLRLIDRLSAVFAYGAAAAVILLATSVFIDVVGRTLFSSPLTGTLEMTAYWWMPMLTLLAFGYTEQRQEHIKVTILLDALPLRMRQIVEGTFGLVATALVMALTYYAAVDALESAQVGQTTASSPPIAIWPFKFVAVVGLAMLSLQAAATAFRYFAGLLPDRQDAELDGDTL
ncbi:TRAP transporter small permease subunit [Amorphus sp. 3PC139-8]|uniref:TRAP transporter small permease subunit n=1 Tax=Amorphus sp. 3PC139-8 TaxID=2735676 RepID=UPI00345CFAB1